MRTAKDYILLFLRGIGMGGADVIPGVSGGTIAFITGIYEELIDSIKSVNVEAVRLLVQFRIADLWRHINGNFLITVVGGILVSVFSLAQLITFLLVEYPVQLWSFFFGLIIISSLSVAREIKDWKLSTFLILFAGIVGAFFITSASPSTTPESLLFVFFSGMVAICAMILPGISGSFILLILGKYEQVLSAVKELDFAVLIVFALGCAIGILSFARLISWSLKRYHNQIIALLVGFMIGSLNKIWPWKEVIEYRVNSKGERVAFVEDNILPQHYLEVTGNAPMFIQAILFFFLGIGLVVMIEKLAQLINPSK